MPGQLLPFTAAPAPITRDEVFELDEASQQTCYFKHSIISSKRTSVPMDSAHIICQMYCDIWPIQSVH